jgi:hypothetical protein
MKTKLLIPDHLPVNHKGSLYIYIDYIQHVCFVAN